MIDFQLFFYSVQGKKINSNKNSIMVKKKKRKKILLLITIKTSRNKEKGKLKHLQSKYIATCKLQSRAI